MHAFICEPQVGSLGCDMNRDERTMPPELPPELMAEILCRLQVKVLLKIRCVSKLWRTFIDSQFFVRTHLNRSLQIRKNHFILLTDSFSNVVKSIDLDLLGSSSFDLHNPPVDWSRECSTRHDFSRRRGKVTSRYRNLPENLQVIAPRWQILGWRPHRQIRVWGTCNGLVLMSGWFPTCCLWNPSTRKHLTLPELEVPEQRRSVDFYGFGYAFASDSFKVIKIVMCKDWNANHTRYEGWVYSLKSNSWTRVTENFPPNVIKCERQPGVLVCEALHWPVKVKYDNDDDDEEEEEEEHDCILAFDLKTEEYRMFSQPKCRNARFYSRLGTLNGSLCLVYSYLPIGFEVWVMGDYGVEESWTRVTLQQEDDFISYPGGFIKYTLGTGKEEEIWLHRDSPFLGGLGFNIMTPEHFGLDGTCHTDVCVSSLVSLDGGDDS